jgi:hypothetical protein
VGKSKLHSLPIMEWHNKYMDICSRIEGDPKVVSDLIKIHNKIIKINSQFTLISNIDEINRNLTACCNKLRDSFGKDFYSGLNRSFTIDPKEYSENTLLDIFFIFSSIQQFNHQYSIFSDMLVCHNRWSLYQVENRFLSSPSSPKDIIILEKRKKNIDDILAFLRRESGVEHVESPVEKGNNIPESCEQKQK